ncbi:MAG: epoxyqueuosine reductase QueH [Erysipelotrichaceae bacterium]|nr:epoxyqueuosine reductase QueH [Erysipelotrichaceae bacterium]
MNNYQKHKQEINNLKGRPDLLIHICCGVCSVYPLKYLSEYFRITIYFTNSNIYPYEEFLKRLEALQTYLKYLNDPEIKLIIADYDNESYQKKVRHLKDEPEGGKRCYLCYRIRMEETFKYAEKNHYEYCTTVMSISNRKNADWLNEIGEQLEKQYPTVKYLHSDFKKGDGITMNDQMNSKLNLYHQNYCGCIYSQR